MCFDLIVRCSQEWRAVRDSWPARASSTACTSFIWAFVAVSGAHAGKLGVRCTVDVKAETATGVQSSRFALRH